MMQPHQPYGFTLIEVVIALAIMAFLSLFTVEAIQRAIKTKVKVQTEIDRTSTVRDALRIMERDINMAFNYRDPNIAVYNLAQKDRQTTATQPSTPGANTGVGTPSPTGQPMSPNAAAQAYPTKTEKIYTQFIGDPQSLDFTTLSNVRMMEDSKISSQAEIGYHLKPCRRRSTQEQSSQCLWRRVANYIHDDITREDGQETVLLENVSDFKLRYLGPGREDEWIDTWITNERGDDLTKGKFPYAVEITIEVKDPSAKGKNKSLRMTMVAAVRNPNNPSKDDPTNPANANGANGVNGVNGQNPNQMTGTPPPPAPGVSRTPPPAPPPPPPH